jgi:hypothetical protein
MVRLRKVINDADPKLKEEFKWHTAVWSASGNVCALGAFKDHIKINFFKGVFEITFAVILGALLWGGLLLRDPQLRRFIPLRH